MDQDADRDLTREIDETLIRQQKSPTKQFWSLGFVWVITLVASTFEIAIGLRNNSLTLLVDGFHNFSDVLALSIAFWALWVAQRPRTDKMTYGWKRVEILGAMVNAVFLLALCFYIVLEAIPRFIRPTPVRGRENSTEDNLTDISNHSSGECSEAVIGDWWYIGIAIAMLCVNVFAAILFLVTGTHGHSHGPGGHGHSHGGGHGHSHGESHSHKDRASKKHGIGRSHGGSDGDGSSKKHDKHKEHGRSHGDSHGHSHDSHDEHGLPGLFRRAFTLNMKVVFLHQIGDSISSLFVLMTAFLLYFLPEERWVVYVDPAVSLLIVIIIVVSIYSVVAECAYILILRVPNEIQVSSLHTELEKVDGVKSVHDLHVWQIAETNIVASMHLVVGVRDCDPGKLDSLIQGCKDILHHFGIHSSTLQIEFFQPTPPSDGADTDLVPLESCKQFCVRNCREDWCCAETGSSKKRKKLSNSH